MGKKSFAINIALGLVMANWGITTSFIPAREGMAFIDEIYKHFAAAYADCEGCKTYHHVSAYVRLF